MNGPKRRTTRTHRGMNWAAGLPDAGPGETMAAEPMRTSSWGVPEAMSSRGGMERFNKPSAAEMHYAGETMAPDDAAELFAGAVSSSAVPASLAKRRASTTTTTNNAAGVVPLNLSTTTPMEFLGSTILISMILLSLNVWVSVLQKLIALLSPTLHVDNWGSLDLSQMLLFGLVLTLGLKLLHDLSKSYLADSKSS